MDPLGLQQSDMETAFDYTQRVRNLIMGVEFYGQTIWQPEKFCWLKQGVSHGFSLFKPLDTQLDTCFYETIEVVSQAATFLAENAGPDSPSRSYDRALAYLKRQIEVTRQTYRWDMELLAQRTRPLFAILNVDNLHYVLLATVDGHSWYLHDSVPGFGREFALSWLVKIYGLCGFTDLNKMSFFEVDHPNFATPETHLVFKQPNGIDCGLHCLERIDYFVATSFRTWPHVSPQLSLTTRARVILDMRNRARFIHQKISSLVKATRTIHVPDLPPLYKK